jgi:hypothetical protein
MQMNIEVTISSTIIGFPTNQINLSPFKDIEKKLKSRSKPAEEIKTLRIVITMASQGNVAVLKRSRYYPSTQELELSSVIQLPENTMIEWGINKKYYLPRPPLKTSAFTNYELDFRKFDTLQDYMTNAAELILNHFVKFGIKFHGKFIIAPNH